MKKFTFKKGGIHPPAHKDTSGMPITPGPQAPLLSILLSQSIGAPSKPVVKAGDRLAAGQPVAEPGGFVGAWIHSPCAGIVKKIDTVRTPQGYPAQAIIIERDAASDETFAYPPLDPATVTPEELVERIRLCGIVGLGGATFPTAVKLTPPKGQKAELLLINGAECEPYLTCDDRLMQEHAEEIALGVYCLMRAARVQKACIAIEDNKPNAIDSMRRASSGYSGMEVVVMKTKYPQGGEKQLIAAVTGREVLSGQLPVSVGVIVDNVATAYAAGQAVAEGRPLTRRVLTVCGSAASAPGNFLVDFGTPLSMLAGADTDAREIVAGGPMMGKSVSCLDAPTTKGFSGLLLVKDPEPAQVQPCLRCAACYSACPMGLEPMLLARQSQAGDWEYAAASSVMDCIECGSCAYTCPSHRPLLDWIRLAKTQVRKLKV